MAAVGHSCVAWACRDGRYWWPAYLCNPATLANDLHILGSSHKAIYRTTRRPDEPRVYYLGSYEFELGTAKVKEWFCPEYDDFIQGPSVSEDILDEWKRALNEAQRVRVNGIVPYLLPSDLNKSLQRPPRTCAATLWSVVWVFGSRIPWMPCLILDPMWLVVKGADNHTRQLIEQAQSAPTKCFLLYNFGQHILALFNQERAPIKLWGCPEQDGFLRGIPRAGETLQVVLREAQRNAIAFLASGGQLVHVKVPGVHFAKLRDQAPLPSQAAPKNVPSKPASPSVEGPSHQYPLRSRAPVPVVPKTTPQAGKKPSSRPKKPQKRQVFPCGLGWVNKRGVCTPLLICSRNEWFSALPAQESLFKQHIDVYFFRTHSFDKWNGRVYLWHHPPSTHIPSVRELQAHEEAKEYYAHYEKLEKVLLLRKQVRHLGN